MLGKPKFEVRVRIINSQAATRDPQENLPSIISEFENDGWKVAVVTDQPKVGMIVVFKRQINRNHRPNLV